MILGEIKNIMKCKFYAETAQRGRCSNVDCLLENCYFSDNFNSCDCFKPIDYKKEPEVINAKLVPDRSMDSRTLMIQNCDKIILKQKSLEIEVKIEKDNLDDFDFISINGHKFKKV